MSKQDRSSILLPGGVPRYVRCYDNGGASADRYTCVFTGRYRKIGDEHVYATLNNFPDHPQGIHMHGFSASVIDRPRSKHLGVRVPFENLPDNVQRAIIADYRLIWDLDSSVRTMP